MQALVASDRLEVRQQPPSVRTKENPSKWVLQSVILNPDAPEFVPTSPSRVEPLNHENTGARSVRNDIKVYRNQRKQSELHSVSEYDDEAGQEEINFECEQPTALPQSCLEEKMYAQIKVMHGAD